MASRLDLKIDARNRAFAARVGANPDGGVPLHLIAGPGWAQSAQGQVILLNLSNLLPRIGPGFRRITVDRSLDVALAKSVQSVHGEGSLLAALGEALRCAVDGDFSVTPAPPDGARTIHVGATVADGNTWIIWTRNWRMGIGLEASESGDPRLFNPISAQWLASATAALLYQETCMHEPPFAEPRPLSRQWTAGAPGRKGRGPLLPDHLVLSRLTWVGGGAVTNATLAPLRYLHSLSGELTVVEPEAFSDTDPNRYLLGGRGDIGRPKVQIIRDKLSHHSGLQVIGIPARVQSAAVSLEGDVVVGVDNVAARTYVQSRWPLRLLEAGTGDRFFHVAHCHREAIFGGGAACQACLHFGAADELPREDREATIVFVSALTGAVMARELVRLYHPGSDRGVGLRDRAWENYVAGDAFRPWGIAGAPFLPRPDCMLCNPVRPHGREVMQFDVDLGADREKASESPDGHRLHSGRGSRPAGVEPAFYFPDRGGKATGQQH